jgi:hypothetical protein
MVTDNDEAVAAVLASTQINDARLRDIASSRGISPRHRPVCWRLLLKYLPMDRREWAASLESNRNNYYSLLNEFKKLPSHEESTMCSSLKAAGIHYESVSITNIDHKDQSLATETKGERHSSTSIENSDIGSHSIDIAEPPPLTPLHREMVSVDSGDPLSTNSDSAWSQFYQDSQIISEIEKDVIRTRQAMPFFAAENVRDCLRRILFLFAKLNPALGYVQGMNELVSTLLYVLSDANTASLADAEADTYHCFTYLMTTMANLFLQAMDHSDSGIHASMEQVGCVEFPPPYLRQSQLTTHLTQIRKNQSPIVYRYCKSWVGIFIPRTNCSKNKISCLSSTYCAGSLRCSVESFLSSSQFDFGTVCLLTAIAIPLCCTSARK